MKISKKITDNKKHKKAILKVIIILFLVLIIATGIILRIWGIGKESYWIDESFSLKYAEEDYSKMSHYIEQDIHPPLHILMLHEWIKLFGTSPESTRSLSAVFGVLIIGVAFLLGRKLFNNKTGLIFATFCALSPILIYYSQEARSYSLLVFLTLVSLYFFLQFIEKPKISNVIIYMITTLFLLYTHVFAVLIVLVQNVFYLYLKRFEVKTVFSRKGAKNLRKWIIIQILIILLYVPWILIVLKQMKYKYYTAWIQIPNGGIIAGTFKEFFGNYFILGIFFILVIYFTIYYLYIKQFNIVNFSKIKKEHKEENNLTGITNTDKNINNKNVLALLLIWIFVPFIVVLIYSWIFQPLYQTRYLLFTLPAIYLLFSWMIVKLTKQKIIRYILLAIICISCFISIFIQVQNLQKDDWKNVSIYLNENVGQKEIVFIHPYYQQNIFSYYYENSCFKIYDVYSCMSNKKDVLSTNWKESCCNDTTLLTSRTSKNHLEDYLDKDIWLVSIRPELTYGDDGLFKYFSEHKKLVSTKEFTQGIKIYHFK